MPAFSRPMASRVGPEVVHVVDGDAGEHGAVGVDDVDRVEPAAQADLEDRRLDLRAARTATARRACRTRSRSAAWRRAPPRRPRTPRTTRHRPPPAADAHALVVAQQVRRGVERRSGSPADRRIDSSIAQVEPLPLVPPTVMTGRRRLDSQPGEYLAPPAPGRARWLAGCWRSMNASQSCSDLTRDFPARRAASHGCVGGLSLQQRQQRVQLVAHLAAVDDHVDGALLEQELGALEALRAASARTVCSITRGPAKPISAFGSAITTSPIMAKLADTPPMVGSVSTEMKGRRALGELGERRGGLRHLHQRQQRPPACARRRGR